MKSNMTPFARIIFPLVARCYTASLNDKLVSVQPMGNPTALDWYFRREVIGMTVTGPHAFIHKRLDPLARVSVEGIYTIGDGKICGDVDRPGAIPYFCILVTNPGLSAVVMTDCQHYWSSTNIFLNFQHKRRLKNEIKKFLRH